MYVKICTGDVLCADGYINYMKCTDILELCTYTDVPSWFQLLICPAGWPVGRGWLLPGVTPIQVQAHLFNRHQPLGLLPFRPAAFPAGWGQVQQTQAQLQAPPRRRGEQPLPRLRPGRRRHRSRPRCQPRPCGVVPASSWSSNRGLRILVLGQTVGATAGALSPLDVLVKGCQDGLQLQLEGVRLHFGIYISHCALVLKCLCIDAVLKRNQNRVDNERII